MEKKKTGMQCKDHGDVLEKYTLEGVKGGYYCPLCHPETKALHDKKYAKMRAGKRNKKVCNLLNEIYEKEMEG